METSESGHHCQARPDDPEHGRSVWRGIARSGPRHREMGLRQRNLGLCMRLLR